MQPGFLICVVVLATAAGGMQMAIRHLGIQLRKLPLPLQKSLDDMNEAALAAGGYQVVRKTKIKNKDLLEGLGTDDYIQWTLEDNRSGAETAARFCSLFVTYYTGNPDQVPHVPEQCYFGSGYQGFANKDISIETRVSNEGCEEGGAVSGGENRFIPARCLVFGEKAMDIWQGGRQFPVIYFFIVNGEYAGNREQTRRIMAKNLFSKYSYYSKVEWRFFDRTTAGTVLVPTQQEAIAASSRLLDVILPILEKEHWPDWEKANKKE